MKKSTWFHKNTNAKPKSALVKPMNNNFNQPLVDKPSFVNIQPGVQPKPIVSTGVVTGEKEENIFLSKDDSKEKSQFLSRNTLSYIQDLNRKRQRRLNRENLYLTEKKTFNIK